ncbi:defensin beta 7 [Mus musculus]|nr:defensin beta 7 [Mus musculus]
MFCSHFSWCCCLHLQLLAKTSTVNELAIGKEANACNGALAFFIRLELVIFVSNAASFKSQRRRQRSCETKENTRICSSMKMDKT